MALVVDSGGNPMATGMGWNINTPRPTDQQILDSSLGRVIRRLQILDNLSCQLAFVRPDDLLFWFMQEQIEIPEGDDTELLQWSLLASRVLGVPLYINREYRYSRVLEIHEGQTVYGNGPFKPGLRMDVKSIIESQSTAVFDANQASFCHAPGVNQFTIRDLQIDGGQYDIDWEATTSVEPWATDLSQRLREAPYYSGLGLVTQNGRNNPTEVILENIHVHDTCGTCMFGVPKIRGRNITLGNSVSGRVLYAFRGECFGLHTYGFTRTSIARITTNCCIDGWTYEGRGFTNPWPANAPQQNVCGIQNFAGDPVGVCELRNIHWDGSDSELSQSFHASANCMVTGHIKNLDGPYTNDVNTGPFSMNFDLVAVDCKPPSLSTFGLANVRSAKIRWVHKTETRDKTAIDWSYTGPEYAVWSPQLDVPFSISVARQAHHAADHEQRIHIHLDHDWPTWFVIHFPDLCIDDGGLRLRTAEEIIPTYVTMSGRVDNRLAVWIGANGGFSNQVVPQLGELAALPIRVIFDGLACNEIPPGNFRGDDPHTIHSEMYVEANRFPLYSNVGIP